MAVLKTILHKKNSSGSYDDVYLRTRVDNVLLTDNSTLLSAKLSSMDTTIAGKAASSHDHAASAITSGTLGVTRGGTGVTSIDALKTALGISSGGATPQIFYTSTGSNASAILTQSTFTLSSPASICIMSSKWYTSKSSTSEYYYSNVVFKNATYYGSSSGSRQYTIGWTFDSTGTSFTIDRLPTTYTDVFIEDNNPYGPFEVYLCFI